MQASVIEGISIRAPEPELSWDDEEPEEDETWNEASLLEKYKPELELEVVGEETNEVKVLVP